MSRHDHRSARRRHPVFQTLQDQGRDLDAIQFVGPAIRPERAGTVGIGARIIGPRLLSQGGGVYRPERDSDIVLRFRTSKGVSEAVVETPGSTLQGVKQP